MQLFWYRGLPQKLPEQDDEPLCVVQLCAEGAGLDMAVEFFEARLQRHHLHGQVHRWTEAPLRRLMQTMAQPCKSTRGDGDTVLLRREATRMVIDVLFAACAAPPVGADLGMRGRVVEILIAFPAVSSGRSGVCSFLRTLARVQRLKNESIQHHQAELQAKQQETEALEQQLEKQLQGAERQCRGLLQRFALLFEAKVEKEKALVGTMDMARRTQENAALPPIAPQRAAATAGASGLGPAVHRHEEPIAIAQRGQKRSPGLTVAEGPGKRACSGRGRGRASKQAQKVAAARDSASSGDEEFLAAGGSAASAAVRRSEANRVSATQPHDTMGLFEPMSSDDEPATCPGGMMQPSQARAPEAVAPESDARASEAKVFVGDFFFG